MTDEPQVQETETQVEDPNALQAADLNTMATILEAVAQRGAIRANEMQLVGALYNKLMGFLIANGLRQVPGDAPGEAPADAPAESEEEVETGEADDA
jgi:hypothetical protein